MYFLIKTLIFVGGGGEENETENIFGLWEG